MKKHLLNFVLSICVISILGCEDAHLESPLIVTGVSVNKSAHKGKYEIIFTGTCIYDAKYYTDTKYNVGDTLK